MTLPEGLVMRPGRSTDRDAVMSWVEEAFVEDDGSPDEPLLVWVRDLFDRPHPSFSPDRWLLVEDPSSGTVVSGLCVFPQVWSYAGIPLRVWRIEIVGTRPDHRRRGLVRLLMDEVHRLGGSAPVDLFTITGIPWYYRQFGYDMAISFGGAPGMLADTLPDEPAGDVGFLPAIADDAGLIAAVHDQMADRWLVTAARDEESWRHAVEGMSPGSAQRLIFEIVEQGEQPVGWLAYHVGEQAVWCPAVCLGSGASWATVGEAVLCRLRDVAALQFDDGNRVRVALPPDHPLVGALAHRLMPHRPRYAWYVRAADFPGLLGRIAPALAANLARSPLAGWEGTLRMSWFTGGARLTVADGGVQVEPWAPTRIGEGDVCLPDLLVTSLIFGRLPIDVLREVHPDVTVTGEEIPPIVGALFPARSSSILAIA